MSVSDFLSNFFTLLADTVESLFGVEGVAGLLNMGENDFILTYLFCFGGFALFGFSILYFVFGFIRGD